jgi:hypothetical protein
MKVKSLLDWSSEPKLEDLAPALATRLSNDKKLAAQLVALLQEKSGPETFAGALVGKIDAQKVVVGQRIDIAGNVIL